MKRWNTFLRDIKADPFFSKIRKRSVGVLSAGAILGLAAGWWGFLYPQLTLNGDTCRVVEESMPGADEQDVSRKAEGEQDDARSADGEQSKGRAAEGSDYLEILNAGRGKIVFRFKLAEGIKEYLERMRGERG